MASEVSSIPADKQDKKTFKTVKEALKARDEGIEVDRDELHSLALIEQGPYECEISFEVYEADLKLSKTACAKNKGHTNFIPINDLNLDSLPDGFKESKILDFLNLQANLTVRIKASFISYERANPKERVYSELCKENAGGKFKRFGTGMVIRVIEGKASDGQVCPCKKCQDSEDKYNEWFTLVVATARHVIFDKSEAKHLEVLLFYNSDDSIKEGGKAIKLDSDITYQRINQDVCSLDIITHDKSLGQILSDNCKQFFEKGQEAAKLFKKEDNDWALLPIVSHPHGCPKHISFGHISSVVREEEEHFAWPPLPSPLDVAWKDVIVGAPKSLKLEYDTPTCHGSSGAFIAHYMPEKENSLSFHERSTTKTADGRIIKLCNVSGDHRLVNIECHVEPDNFELWRKLTDLINNADKRDDLWKFILKDEHFMNMLPPMLVPKLIRNLTVKNRHVQKMKGPFLEQLIEKFKDNILQQGGQTQHTGDYEWIAEPAFGELFSKVIDVLIADPPSTANNDAGTSSHANTDADTTSAASNDAGTSSAGSNDAGTSSAAHTDVGIKPRKVSDAKKNQ